MTISELKFEDSALKTVLLEIFAETESPDGKHDDPNTGSST